MWMRGGNKLVGTFVLGVLGLVVGGICAGQTAVSPGRAMPFPDRDGKMLTAAPFATVKAGSLVITLEKTPLADVQKAFGGTVRHGGDAGGASHWLCYTGLGGAQEPIVTWFVSGDEMSSEDHSISEVAVMANPGGAAKAGCSKAPAGLVGVDAGLPGVGANLVDVTKRFGAARPDTKGFLSYQSELHVDGMGDTASTTVQSVSYRVRAGVVVAVSLRQVTSD